MINSWTIHGNSRLYKTYNYHELIELSSINFIQLLMKMKLGIIPIISLLLVSCSESKFISSDYSQFALEVPPVSRARPIAVDSSHYSIVETIPLSLSEDVGGVAGMPLFSKNRIYMLDARRENVLAFDAKGKFLYKIGGKGHARNELVGTIRTFDVDHNTGAVHVYDRSGHKILIFNGKGKFVKSVRLSQCLPSSICLASDGERYIASCDCMSTKDGNTKLVIIDAGGNVVSTIMEISETNNITSEGVNTIPLYSDHGESVVYLPMLSDSLIVLSGDTVSHVVKLDFSDGFISQSVMEKSKQEGQTPSEGKVMFITKAMVNDNLACVEFMGKPEGELFSSNYTYVYNRKRNEAYFQRGSMGFSKMLGSVCSIEKDCFVVLITDDNVLEVERHFERGIQQTPSSQRLSSIEDFAHKLYREPSADAITRKMQVPLLVKIKMK